MFYAITAITTHCLYTSQLVAYNGSINHPLASIWYGIMHACLYDARSMTKCFQSVLLQACSLMLPLLCLLSHACSLMLALSCMPTGSLALDAIMPLHLVCVLSVVSTNSKIVGTSDPLHQHDPNVPTCC